MSEDYTRARTLATFEHLGHEFRVVRRRVNGKPWRGYLTFLHDNVVMANSIPRTTDPDEAAAYWLTLLQRGFATSDALQTAIAEQRKRMGGE